MSAVVAPVRSASPPQDRTLLVSLPEAAALLGWSQGHLRRVCARELAGRNLAWLLPPPPPEKGRSEWWLDRRYDPRLAGGRTGEMFAAPDTGQFPIHQVDLAHQRVACVGRLREARRRPEPQAQWLPDLIDLLRREFPRLRISASTLFRWDRVYRTPADLLELVDARGGDKRHHGDPLLWAEFEKLFLVNRRSVSECWRMVNLEAQQRGLRWCSLRACHRLLDDKIPPQKQAYHRDPALYRSKHEPYIKQDPERFAAGECWVGDHTQLDFWAIFQGRAIRPWLTTWIDWRTRMLMGWCLAESPSSDTILAALHSALSNPATLTAPAAVCIDNGKDFDSWVFHGQTKQVRLSKVRVEADESQFKGLFARLGIEVHFSLAYSPDGKARMETWYRPLHGTFDRTFPTWCGSKPAEKPEYLEHLLANRPHCIPAFEPVRGRLGNWIEAGNARQEHQIEDLVQDGARLSPAAAMAAWCTVRRRLADPSALDLLLQHWHRPVTVGAHGVRIAPLGASLAYGAFDVALGPHKGRQVLVSYDPNDLRQVRVWDMQGKYIATCAQNEVGGLAGEVGRRHLSEAMRRKRAYNNALKVVGADRYAQIMTAAELAAEAARAERTPPPSVQPERLRIVQTHADHQSERVRAGDRRMAVGAESLGGDDLDIFAAADAAAPRRPAGDGDPLPLDFEGLGGGDDDAQGEADAGESVSLDDLGGDAGERSSDSASHILDQVT